jgi:hypothetical protein
MQSIEHSEPVPPTEPTASRLRTVTGSRWPRKCACGCGQQIPRDPEVRYVVDFGAPKPYLAYLREHSPDYGTYRGSLRAKSDPARDPPFRPASELIRESALAITKRAREIVHEDAKTTTSPEAGFALASGRLVVHACELEQVYFDFVDCLRVVAWPTRFREREDHVDPRVLGNSRSPAQSIRYQSLLILPGQCKKYASARSRVETSVLASFPSRVACRALAR